jgi:hypothetical protein
VIGACEQEGYTAGQVALLRSDIKLADVIRFFGNKEL